MCVCVCVCVCVCIVIHRQNVSLYHNSSVRLNPRDASSRDQNPVDFTSVEYLIPKLTPS